MKDVLRLWVNPRRILAASLVLITGSTIAMPVAIGQETESPSAEAITAPVSQTPPVQEAVPAVSSPAPSEKPASSLANPEAAKHFAALGHQHYTEGKMGEAVGYYEAALGQNPRDLSIEREYLDILEQTRGWDKEKMYCAQQVTLPWRKEDDSLKLRLAHSYARLGQNNDASKMLADISSSKFSPEQLNRYEWLQAVTHSRLGHLPQAYEYARKLLARNPKNTDALAITAEYHQSKNDTARAIDAYTKLTQQEPGYQKGWQELGKLHEAQGNHDKAQKAYEQALAMSPQDLQLLLKVGKLQHDMGQTAAAYDTYKKVLEVQPENTQALREVGTADYQKKNYLSAEISMTRYVSQVESDSEARYYLAEMAYARTGDKAAYASELQKLSQMEPKNKSYLEKLVELLQQDPGQLSAVLDRLLALNPKHTKSLVQAAELAMASGNWKKAVAMLDRAIKLDSKNPDLYFLRAQAQENLKQQKLALKDYLMVAKLNSRHTQAHLRAGMIYANMKEWKSAKKYLMTAAKLDPTLIEPQVTLGNVFFNEDDYASAEKYYAQAVKIDSENTMANTRLGHIYTRLGDAAKSVYHFEKAYRQGNPSEALSESLAKSYMAAGRPAEALPLFQKLSYQHPSDAQKTFHVGRAYLQYQNAPEAINWLNKAVQQQPGMADYHKALGDAYKLNKKHDMALSQYTFAMKGQPRDTRQMLDQGEMYLRFGMYDSAINVLEKSSGKTKDKTMLGENYLMLGKAYEAANKPGDAKKVYEKYLKMLPNGKQAEALKNKVSSL